MISNSINARYLFCSRFRNKIAIHGSNPFSSLGASAAYNLRSHNSGPYEHGVGKTTGALFGRCSFFSTTTTTTSGFNSTSRSTSNTTGMNVVTSNTQTTAQTFDKNGSGTIGGTGSQFSSSAQTEHHHQHHHHCRKFRSVYVHQLSQIVLEYLQNFRHEWIVEKGLDQSLIINRDGSFEMKAVAASAAATAHTTTMLHHPYDHYPAPHQQYDHYPPPNNPSHSSSPSSNSSSIQSYVDDNNNNIRIWTCYDEKEKKHWLTVRKGCTFRKQFLLQDNIISLLKPWDHYSGGGEETTTTITATAMNNNNTSHLRNERIRSAVNDMIRAVDQVLEEKQSA